MGDSDERHDGPGCLGLCPSAGWGPVGPAQCIINLTNIEIVQSDYLSEHILIVVQSDYLSEHTNCGPLVHLTAALISILIFQLCEFGGNDDDANM